MAASDYDFNLTRTQIIQSAFELCGSISDNQPLTGEQGDRGEKRLNLLVKEMQNDHIFLWTLRSIDTPLISGTDSYAVEDDPAVIDIFNAKIDDGTNVREIEVVPWHEYDLIPKKDDPGIPTLVALDARISPTIYVWPVINATGYILKCLSIVKLKDFDSASGTPDFTQRWLNCLVYGLAAELAPGEGLPLSERDWLIREFEKRKKLAKRGDFQKVTARVARGAFDTCE